MRTNVLAAVVLGIVVLAVTAKPDRVPPSQPKELKATVPDLSGETNWGRLQQTGGKFTITGHPIWDAVGEFRADGKVSVLWTLKSSGEPCPGLYSIADAKTWELIGRWGYVSSGVRINEQGELEGPTMGDTTHRIPLLPKDEP